MATFQAKIGWKRLTNRENKNCHSVTQRVIENSKNIVKKFKKLKNPVMTSFQTKISLKMPRNREKKNCRSISFPPNV